MFELYQLEQLLAFYQYQTLSQTAQHLHISQPALSRSMQKLEESLEVPIFDRTKNKITLNENGLKAVELAKKVVDETYQLKKELLAFEKSHHTFSIGSCAPAPIIELTPLVSRAYPNMSVLTEQRHMDTLIKGLNNHEYTLIIMPYDIEDENIESIEFIQEQLYFSLPLNHPLANKKELSFEDMDHDSMLLMSNIGFWKDMHDQHMPHTRFLVQQDRQVFYELMHLSHLPSFTSDLVINKEGKQKNRKIIPISNPEAHATFYVWYLKDNEKKLKSLLYSLAQNT